MIQFENLMDFESKNASSFVVEVLGSTIPVTLISWFCQRQSTWAAELT